MQKSGIFVLNSPALNRALYHKPTTWRALGIEIPTIPGSDVEKLSCERRNDSANMTFKGCFIDMHIDKA